MEQPVCDICGKKFTYKEKLLAVWVSPTGRMSLECCGIVWVPRFLSYAFFYSLLFASIIFAFYFDALAFFGIVLAWCFALSFLTPFFTRYRRQRDHLASDSFTTRVFSKFTWNAPLVFLYTIIIIDILGYLKYPDAGLNPIIVLISAGALAAIILTGLVIAGIRVLLENKRKPSA